AADASGIPAENADIIIIILKTRLFARLGCSFSLAIGLIGLPCDYLYLKQTPSITAFCKQTHQ
ncbi:MAG: hypothetical protein ABGX44_05805, partial [Candidatus Poseidoniia archaeon]